MLGRIAVFCFACAPIYRHLFLPAGRFGVADGWRGHLKIDRFIAHTPALGPREACSRGNLDGRASLIVERRAPLVVAVGGSLSLPLRWGQKGRVLGTRGVLE